MSGSKLNEMINNSNLNKITGLAHLCFEEVKSAKECVKYLHGKSVMGQQLNCYIDPLAKSCLKMFTDLTEEKKPDPEPEPEPEPQQTQKQNNFSPQDNVDWSQHRFPPPAAMAPPTGHHAPPPQRRESREDLRDPRRRQSRDSYNSYEDYGHLEAQRPLEAEFQQPQIMPPASNVHDANYWQEEAKRYAASLAAQANVQNPAKIEAENDLNDLEEDEFADGPLIEMKKDENDEDDCDNHDMDLDTRLKMLMKGKAGSAMPSFLLNEINGSDEEDEDEEGQIKEDDLKNIDSEVNNLNLTDKNPEEFQVQVQLSRAPSPFLSQSHYNACHEAWENQRLEEHLSRLASLNKKSPKSDDRMSLSSLSSGENQILQQSSATNPLPNYYGYYPPPPPGFDPGTWYSQPGMYQVNGHQAYDYGQYPQQHYYGDNQANQATEWQDPYAAIKESLKSGKKSKKNIFRPIVK